MANIEKLRALAQAHNADWITAAEKDINDHGWLQLSQAIALRILRTLRAKNMTQKDLAKAMDVTEQQVSKIVKGGENLSLQTISKIETALGIQLFSIPQYALQIAYEQPQMHVVVSINDCSAMVFEKKKNIVDTLSFAGKAFCAMA